MCFIAGQRIQISIDYHWAEEALGTVVEHPAQRNNPEVMDDPVGKCFRLVKTLSGHVPYYWVVFDEPQYDADGDGPYKEAEIPEDMLINIE